MSLTQKGEINSKVHTSKARKQDVQPKTFVEDRDELMSVPITNSSSNTLTNRVTPSLSSKPWTEKGCIKQTLNGGNSTNIVCRRDPLASTKDSFYPVLVM